MLLLSVAVRLPFFFPAVLNWDESTFILIGQSIADGHLPYVQLWDVKPPLLFGFFALVTAFSGHDIVGIRVAGTLCVAATAFIVHRLASQYWRPPAAAYAAGLCVLLASTSLLEAGATMSELVMLPPLVGAVYLLLREDESIGRFFWVGILMAAATLVRLNTAIAVIAVGLLILADPARPRARALRNLTAYCGGGVLLVAATCLPFLLAGRLQALWEAAVVAAFARAGSEHSALDNLGQLSRYALGLAPDQRMPWLTAFAWVAAIGGVVAVWRGRTRGMFRLTVVAAATGVGIVLSGGEHLHYLIQLAPFAAILAAAWIEYSGPTLRRMVWGLTGVVTLLSSGPLLAEYRGMFGRAFRGEALRYGPAYDIAAFLRRENPAGRPVYLLTDHVAYWLIRSSPPTGIATHPSTIAKPEVLAAIGTTTERELARVFGQRPEFVVLLPDDWFLTGSFRIMLDATLSSDYLQDTEIGGRRIYRRKSSR